MEHGTPIEAEQTKTASYLALSLLPLSPFLVSIWPNDDALRHIGPEQGQNGRGQNGRARQRSVSVSVS